MYTFHCPRCGDQFEPLDTRVESERVCAPCRVRSAQIPMGLQQPMGPRHDRNDAKSLSPHESADNDLPSGEIWLKVAVHIAGMMALLATLAGVTGLV